MRMGSLLSDSDSTRESIYSDLVEEGQDQYPKGKVEADFLHKEATRTTTTVTTLSPSPHSEGLCLKNNTSEGPSSPLLLTNNTPSRSVIMNVMTKSTVPSGTGIGERWTTNFYIIPRAASRRFSKEFTSLSSYSICILIILSTFWSTSLGMANKTAGGELIGSLSSSVEASTANPPSILARPALNQHQHQHQPQHNQHHHPRSSSLIEGHDIIIGGGGHPHPHHHKCYVCLPTDRTSIEAQEILKTFKEVETQIPDCASFTANNKTSFEFRCPQDHRGCLLRIDGTSVSRTCARFQLNDCKTANSVELCYCSGPLCNENKFTMSPPEETGGGGSLETESEEKAKSRLLDEKDEAESRKYFQKGETDDEDLLEMQDDIGTSGDGEDDADLPGVIDQYTTTPKPTLVPNLRGDSSRFKTTVPPASGASNIVPQLMMTTTLIFICSFLIPYHHHHHFQLVNNRP